MNATKTNTLTTSAKAKIDVITPMETAVVEDKKSSKPSKTKETTPTTGSPVDRVTTEKLQREWVEAEALYEEELSAKNALTDEQSKLKRELSNPSMEWTEEQILSKQQRLSILPTLIDQATQKCEQAARAADRKRQEYKAFSENARAELEFLRVEVEKLDWSYRFRGDERAQNIRAARRRIEEAKDVLYQSEIELDEAMRVESDLKEKLEITQKRLAEVHAMVND